MMLCPKGNRNKVKKIIYIKRNEIIKEIESLMYTTKKMIFYFLLDFIPLLLSLFSLIQFNMIFHKIFYCYFLANLLKLLITERKK